jgi:hypothetical protein
MTIIDSQVHAYEANTPKRPWHSVPNWPDHVTGDEMVAAMDKVGVDGAPRESNSCFCRERANGRFGSIGFVPKTSLGNSCLCESRIGER